MNLDELRTNLSSVDSRLIELIAERQQLAGEIGRAKQSAGRATRDFEREKDVLEMARQKAESLSIDPNVAEEVMRTLIRSSLTSQERYERKYRRSYRYYDRREYDRRRKHHHRHS